MITPQEPVAALPERRVPITTVDQIQQELPRIVQASLQDIEHDKFHSLPSSANGSSMRMYARTLLSVDLAAFYVVLLSSLAPIFQTFGQNCNVNQLLRSMTRLRLEQTFMKDIQASISTATSLSKQFVQRLLTQIVTNYFKRQNNLMQTYEEQDAALVTDKDKQVIFYICGYIIHKLRKKYLKLKSNKMKLLQCLDILLCAPDADHNVPSSWTDKMDRGGLKKTRKEFFTIFVQIERWIRDIVSKDKLTTDSLVNLKTVLMDYKLLRCSWEKIFPNTSTVEWTVLEHSLGLFLKVRGFAVTKLVRKKLLLEQKKNKAKAGSKRKALRKELKSLN